MRHKLPLNFVLSFCRDKIPGKGEDCYCYSFCDNAGMIGVFDGCGGSGARKHAYYSGKSEAYMASRICAGAFYDCFRMHFPGCGSVERFASEVLWPTAVQQLVKLQPPKEEGSIQIRGSMVRTLPTTAAAAITRQLPDGDLEVTALWAGDSRIYVLDSRGLAQLTLDDTSVKDPMENIYEDGVLRNVFASDRSVRLNCNQVRVKPPFAVIAATDGCYGYVTTPMEFEGMILRTLQGSFSAAQWEQELADTMGSIAGDDHTLCLAAFGYDSFEALQRSLAARYEYLRRTFLAPVQNTPVEQREPRFALWERYKPDYMRYIKDGKV